MTQSIFHPAFIATGTLILSVLSGINIAAALGGFLFPRRKSHMADEQRSISCPGCGHALEYIEDYYGWYCLQCEDYFDEKDIGRKLS